MSRHLQVTQSEGPRNPALPLGRHSRTLHTGPKCILFYLLRLHISSRQPLAGLFLQPRMPFTYARCFASTHVRSVSIEPSHNRHSPSLLHCWRLPDFLPNPCILVCIPYVLLREEIGMVPRAAAVPRPAARDDCSNEVAVYDRVEPYEKSRSKCGCYLIIHLINLPPILNRHSVCARP